MSFLITVFNSPYDTITNRNYTFGKYEDFKNLFFALSKKEAVKPVEGVKNPLDALLISPAMYKEGATRSNSNVICWKGWCAMDVDDYEGDMEDIKIPYQAICYSTASSTKEKPKFRLIFPMKDDVLAKNIKHFWYALQQELGGVGDEQTKDFSRMFYIPADYPNAYNFIFEHSGEWLNPNALMAKHEYVEKQVTHFLDGFSDSFKKRIMSRRMEQMKNRNITWNSYRDCPFVSEKMLSEYKMLTIHGWYRKLYSLMVSISIRAIKRGYPITAQEVEALVREIDRDTGKWYEKRKINIEAERAINYAYKNTN